MHWNDILDDVISGLQPESVPIEYIIMAKLIDQFGIERTIRGAELIEFMADPEKANVYEARVILDVRKIRKTMNADIIKFFENLLIRLADED